MRVNPKNFAHSEYWYSLCAKFLGFTLKYPSGLLQWYRSKMWLSQLGGVTYIQHQTGSTLVQVMTYHLVGTKPLPEPMLSYCQLDPRNKLQWNLNYNTKLFIHENAFITVLCKMATILSRVRWVKDMGQWISTFAWKLYITIMNMMKQCKTKILWHVINWWSYICVSKS